MVRVRRGPLRASFRAADGPARMMFSVPRSVGNAVVRNRARRRLRETLRQLAREGSVTLRGGDYLWGVSSSLERMSAEELRAALVDLAGRLERL